MKEQILIITPYLDRTGSSIALNHILNYYSINYNLIVYVAKNKTLSERKKKIKYINSFSSIHPILYYLNEFLRKYLRIDIEGLQILFIIKRYKITKTFINTLTLASFAKKIHNAQIPYILYIHEHPYRYVDLPEKYFIEQFEYALKIIVPSSLIKEYILEKHQHKTHVYQSLYSFNSNLIEINNTYINNLNLEKFNFIWITSGSFIREKGIIYLFEILSFLKEYNSCLIWCGNQYNNAFSIFLRYYLEEKELNNLILTGNIEQNELHSLMKISNGFISLSTYESLGLSIYEASSYKLPVVAFDEIGIKEVISNLRIIENYNLNEFKQEMSRIMKTKETVESCITSINLRTDISIFNFN